MKSDKLIKEARRFQKLAGLLKEENELQQNKINPELIPFLNSHLDEIKDFLWKVVYWMDERSNNDGADYYGPMIKNITKFEEDNQSGACPDKELGVSFMFKEDVLNLPNGEFVGEEGSEPEEVNIGGKDLFYITYNI